MEEGRDKRGKGVRVTAIKYSDTHVQKWCKKKPGVLFGSCIKKESKITKGAQPGPIAKLGFGSPGYTEDRGTPGPPRMSSQPALSPWLTSISSSLWASGLGRLI